MIGIVVPAHNEAAVIVDCLAYIRRCAQHPQLFGEVVEFIVVADVTPDQMNHSPSTIQKLTLDMGAIEAAKQNLSDGAVTPGYGPWRDDIVQLLNDALATELVCVLR